MIIVCHKCSARLQVDDTKAPARPFTIRCPKCNGTVDTGSPNRAPEQSATAVGSSPATGDPRFEHPIPAPLFQLQPTAEGVPGASATEKLFELLSGVLSQPAPGRSQQNNRPSWDPRKALVCLPDDHRELVARALAENGYQVFIAQDTRQAVERMRENQLDVVILDHKFDPTEQGSVFVSREVNILRPAQRRRLFFVLVSPSLRTMDAHTAFLNNANAIINVNEIEELPRLLERGMRAYNELYKEFNNVMGTPAL